MQDERTDIGMIVNGNGSGRREWKRGMEGGQVDIGSSEQQFGPGRRRAGKKLGGPRRGRPGLQGGSPSAMSNLVFADRVRDKLGYSSREGCPYRQTGGLRCPPDDYVRPRWHSLLQRERQLSFHAGTWCTVAHTARWQASVQASTVLVPQTVTHVSGVASCRGTWDQTFW